MRIPSFGRRPAAATAPRRAARALGLAPSRGGAPSLPPAIRARAALALLRAGHVLPLLPGAAGASPPAGPGEAGQRREGSARRPGPGRNSRLEEALAAARRLPRTLALLCLTAHAAYLAATSLLVLAYARSDPSATVLMAYRAWGYGWKLEAPRPLKLAKVPAFAKSMLVAVEDGKFWEHHGIDLEAVRRAREVNARAGRLLYGGSTLTMQLARTLFLVPEKSYLRKYLEVLVAFELELFLPKERILELYFGYAEWGRGVFGIEAAARRHYGRSLSRLSREEVARLVALLSSPIRYTPATLERSGILAERYRYLLRRFVEGGGQASAPPPPAKPEEHDPAEGSSVEGAPAEGQPPVAGAGESASAEAARPGAAPAESAMPEAAPATDGNQRASEPPNASISPNASSPLVP